MKNILIFICSLLAFHNASGQNTSTVVFFVHNTDYFFFIPERDTLYITGNFPDHFWPMPGTDPEMMLTDPDHNLIYTLQMELPIGSYSYKYFFGSGWNCGEWLGNPNRYLDVPDNGHLYEIHDIPGWIACYYTIAFNITCDSEPVENASIDFERFPTQYTDASGHTSYDDLDYVKSCPVFYSISAEGYYSVMGSFYADGCDVNNTVELSMIRTSVNCFPDETIKIETLKDHLLVNSEKEYRMTIINISGQEVLDFQIIKGMNDIVISGLKSGMYILKFYDDTLQFSKKLLIP
jgi:hypothetical protein